MSVCSNRRCIERHSPVAGAATRPGTTTTMTTTAAGTTAATCSSLLVLAKLTARFVSFFFFFCYVFCSIVSVDDQCFLAKEHVVGSDS